tara:strand:- start:342 stop:1190 length:849 start_codon:yes stop_codon:yes gene_type:complete
VNNELISVVIPCYNSGSTIRKTIDSIKRQSWRNIEIIVIDDGSDDSSTIEVLKELDDITIYRQTNKGLPAARNLGFLKAKGKYILPLDADDWLEHNAIEELLKSLLNNANSSYSFTYWQLHGEAKGILKKDYNFFEQLFLNQLPYCILIPKDIWDSVGQYDESMKEGYEDWEFNIRLGSQGHFGVLVPLPLFNYQISSKGMLISKSSRIHGQLWSEIQMKHLRLYRPIILFKTWLRWRNKASTYPLLFYFGWLILYKILPISFFGYIVNKLRTFSRSGKLRV